MVVQATIKQALKDMMNILKKETDADAGMEKSAELLSKIIMDAILSAEVVAGQTVSTGVVPVQTVPTTGTGATTTPATGTTTTNGSLI